MSFCRWSSDNWRCDVYSYEDCAGGFTTHVAGNRIEGEIPEVPNMLDVDNKTWLKAHQKQMDFLKTAEHKPIGLPCDGETFNDPDLLSFLTRLKDLKEMGYNVPPWVIEEVQAELNQT